MPNRSIEFDSERQLHKLYGENPENLLAIEKSTHVKIVARGNTLHLEGDPLKMDHCEEFFSLLRSAKEQGFVHNKYDIFRFLDKVNQGKIEDIKDLLDHPLCLQIRKKSVVPRNLGSVNS